MYIYGMHNFVNYQLKIKKGIFIETAMLGHYPRLLRVNIYIYIYIYNIIYT